MKLTEQQSIVLFDIVKSTLYFDVEQFGGYSKEQIMTLLNDIIKQQDNQNLIDNIEISNSPKAITNIVKNENITDFWDD
jgi:hypothetical protein